MAEKTLKDHALEWYAAQKIPFPHNIPHLADHMYRAWVSCAFAGVGSQDHYLEVMYGD